MHIGGGAKDGAEYSFGIPAWMLFNPYNYPLDPGSELSPIT
jgi:hypothetical protein